jgi:predicted transcriptional regulator
MPKSVTIDLDEPVLEALDRAAEQRGRSRADIIAEAVRDYLETQRWQLEKIKAGIAAANRGDFASEDEIERIVGKYAAPE